MGYEERQRRKLWEVSLSRMKGSIQPTLRSVETTSGKNRVIAARSEERGTERKSTK
jgi:hypothetical protein